MADSTNISVPLKGMIQDVHILNTDKSVYSFALNAIAEDYSMGNTPNIQNEPSNQCAVSFPLNYQIVGFKEIIEQNRVLYFLHNPQTGVSQIGEVLNCEPKDSTDKIKKIFCKNCPEYVGEQSIPLEKQEEICYCNYRVIISSNCLNFNIDYPIDIEYKITNCALQVYFTDNINERRFIYFDYLDNDVTSELVLQDRFKTYYTGGGPCVCPIGYTYNLELDICEKIVLTPITPSGVVRNACRTSSIAYTNFGVALYSSYSTDGTGVSTIQHLSDPYWSNTSVVNNVGVLNRTAIWACGADGNPQGGTFLPTNEYIGFLFPITITETKTFFVGIAGDNRVRIRVDCNDIVDMNESAMGVQYPAASTSAPFKYWHIYPVTLTAGRHIIELTGYNTGSVAGFGAEIYDNTAAEIIASTDGTGLNIIFTTADKGGQPLQVSNSFSGTCASGECLDIIEGELFCRSIITAPADCTSCPTIIYNDDLDCNKLKIHSDFNRPCIQFKGFVNGGNLKAGSYQLLIAYADSYGNPTSEYFPATPIMPLFTNPITFETNYITNKGLSFEVLNLKADSIFQNYNVVVAQTIDQFTEFILVGTFNTTNNTYVYTGFEPSVKRLSPTEVLYKRPFYQKAKGVTKANNYLFYTGVSEYPILNLQKAVNTIELQWETVAIKEKAYRDPRNTFYFHTYQRDEVYPFSVVFEFDNGRETCAFHIPGRAATNVDLEIINNADVIQPEDCDLTLRNKRWEVYNTGNVLGGDYTYNDNCEIDNCWEYGKFAYWESTELYPSVSEVWGELCGKPIRHHKFPDSCITHIHDSLNGDKAFNENNYVFPIGVRVNHESVLNALAQAVVDGLITQQQRDSIKSYRLLRGNRVGNKSIDAKGLLFNMFKYNKFNKDYYFPNYAYNDLSADSFLNGTSLVNSRYTFHSPDIHFINSGLGNILKIETEEYGKTESYFTYSDCEAKHKFISTFAYLLAFGLGVAAAISATGEKTCKVVTYKGPTKQQPFNTSSSGNTPVVLVSGGGTAIISTVVNLPYSGNTSVPEVTTIHNTTDGTDEGTDPETGEKEDIDDFETKEITYCKGQPFQVFNSDTFLGTLFTGVNKVIQRTFLGILEMNKILDTIRTLIPKVNYGIQHNSVGKYNNYTCVAEGNKVRKLDKTAYLNSTIQEVDEPSNNPNDPFETVNINNWNRESSVYLKTNTVLSNPLKADNSKVSMSDLGFGISDLEKSFSRDIASYYVSIKNIVPNQYGQLCTIDYLETSSCSFFLNRTYTACQSKVFGGDTFINRFALKRKMPFFIHNMCGLDDNSDVLYKELGNVGVPKYYFNTPQPLGEKIGSLGFFPAILSALTEENDKNYDIKKNHLFHQEGVIHLYNYGIPYFLVESDINVDYRHGQNNKDKDFYPHNTDLKTWLEEENVPIVTDNYYFYNRTYSKQNHESTPCASCILELRDLTCQLSNDNRLIYSEPTDTENKNDNWLIFKANNLWDFDLTKGKLISADGIENDKILARLEKGTQIFAAYNEIQATEQNIQVGTGGIFKTRPKDIAITDLGYAGTQHRDIVHTEYGHIWADAQRGQVFNLATGGAGIEEISKNGMKSWFKENLPFQLKKDFKHYNIIDNNLNGVGLHYCFDKRFNRLLITKLDYKVIDKEVKYNKVTNKFYITTSEGDVIVQLWNPKYFCNKSWTISYNFYDKSWTSFHTYHPLFYTENIETFDSAIFQKVVVNGTLGNMQKLYTHNFSNKSYQVFYGKLEAFIIEWQTKQDLVNNVLHSIDYYVDVIRYHNEFDTFYNQDKTFNKAIIYNDRQTSGLLTFKKSNKEDLTEVENYPKRTTSGYEILTTNNENIWSFNQFWDVTKNQQNNIPLFNYDCNNVNKQLNAKAIDYDKTDFDRARIRQRICKVRLIQDIESRYKYIFNFAINKQKQSFK